MVVIMSNIIFALFVVLWTIGSVLGFLSYFYVVKILIKFKSEGIKL